MTDENVKSTKRAFEFLELFARVQRELSVAAISKEFGYPQSSVSAIVRTMVRQGYLSYNARSRTYLPTARLPFLVGWIGAKLFDEGRVRELMQELSDVTGETIILGTQNGLRAQYLQVIDATGPVRLHASPGCFRSLTHSAIGLMLISFYPNAQLGALLRRLNAEQPDPACQVNSAEMLRTVEQIRRQRYAFSVGGITTGGGAIAMLLPEKAPERMGATPLVIGIGAAETNLHRNQAKLLDAMQAAVARRYSERRHPEQGARRSGVSAN